VSLIVPVQTNLFCFTTMIHSNLQLPPLVPEEAKRAKNVVPLPPCTQILRRDGPRILPPLCSIVPQNSFLFKPEAKVFNADLVQRNSEPASAAIFERKPPQALESRKRSSETLLNREDKELKKKERPSPKKWTEEEDAKLVEYIKSNHPSSNYGKWSLIASQLCGRTGNSCFQRWKRVLCPNINKSFWTIEEEEKLLEAISLFGDGKPKISWSQVADHVSGRTDLQCRYHHSIIQKSKQVPFDKVEDSGLEQLVKDSGAVIDWTRISCKLNKLNYRTHVSRPPIECRNRHSQNSMVL